MQLVAYGAQDIYLTGTPQITFFKVVYRRHTNFAIEAVEQTFNGTADFGRKVTCTVSRNGDLIHKTYLQIALPALATSSGVIGWVDYIGHNIIDYVSIDIGGQEIDKHYGDWLNIWNELTQTAEKSAGYDVMVGQSSALTSIADGTTPATTLYVPLQFWFNRNAGLALPLVALAYHEVKINVQFKPLASLVRGGGTISNSPVLGATSLFIDYIYLDNDERRQFAQVQHEYLIEQLQFSGAESYNSTSIKSKLALNHPVKELVWVFQLDASVTGNDKQLDNYTNSTTGTGAQTITDAKLQLNGTDRFAVRSGDYFNLVQPYQHHTRIPSTGIYVYSFAISPEEHQPSGSVNMSRIDNATLLMTRTTADAGQLRVYARSLNVLRVMSGMAGMAYSN